MRIGIAALLFVLAGCGGGQPQPQAKPHHVPCDPDHPELPCTPDAPAVAVEHHADEGERPGVKPHYVPCDPAHPELPCTPDAPPMPIEGDAP